MPQPNYNDIIRQLEDAQSQANRANMQRYADLMQTINDLGQQVGSMGTYGQAQDAINQVGQAARTRVEQNAVRQGALAEQDLISRGLGSTTVRTSAHRGVQADAERQQQQIDEMVASQRAGLLERRAGVEMGVGGMMADAIQGRYDEGPNLGLYAQLLQASAAAGDQKPAYAFVPNTPSTPMYGERAGGGPAVSSGSRGGRVGERAGGGGTNTGARVIGPGAGIAYDGLPYGYNPSFNGAGGSGNPAGSNPQVVTGGAGQGAQGGFDDSLFEGQPVFGGGNVLGTYGQGGQVNPYTSPRVQPDDQGGMTFTSDDGTMTESEAAKLAGGQDMEQIRQQAKSILRSTAGGLVPDDSYTRFQKTHGMSPEQWLRQHG
jgi:hypothetical protein